MISGVARNFVWGVQLDIFGQKSLQILSFCKLKAKTQLYLVHNSLGLGGCKCPIAPPLATLLDMIDIIMFRLNESSQFKQLYNFQHMFIFSDLTCRPTKAISNSEIASLKPLKDRRDFPEWIKQEKLSGLKKFFKKVNFKR
jgi:hypothetical protein